MKSPGIWIYITAAAAVGTLVIILALFYGAGSPAEAPAEVEPPPAAGPPPAAAGGATPDEEFLDPLVEGNEAEEDSDSFFPPENQKQVVLFFQSRTSERLYPELRTIVRTASVLDQAKQVVVELISGSRQGHLPVVPPSTRLRELYRIGPGTVCVDFSQDLVDDHSGGSAAEIATLYAIVNSLTVNFPEIKKVRLLIEGEERETLKSHVDLTRTFGQDLSLVDETFL